MSLLNIMGVWRELFWTMTFFIRLGRRILDYLTSWIGKVTYGTRMNALPAIDEAILLIPAVQLAERIRNREITSENVMKAYIKRIRVVNPLINAVVANRFMAALNEAKEADAFVIDSGWSVEELASQKPLLGVPFSVKNSIAVKGLPWNAGSVCRKNVKSDCDSESIRSLQNAGAIPLVMTNVPELCMWFDAHNLIYGSTKNPYDLSRIPGGSSGGEAALIASAASVMGIGNDVGGSLRFPAFFCGIYSHKPTPGIVPMDLTFPEPVNEMINYACAGPLCRYSKDLKPILKVLAGDNSFKLKLDEPVNFSRVKFLYITEIKDPMISPLQEEIKVAINTVLNHFQNVHGSTVQCVSMPLLNEMFVIWMSAMRVVEDLTFHTLLDDGLGQTNLLVEFIRYLLRRPRHTLPVLLFALLEKMVPPKDSGGYKLVLKKLDRLRSQFEELLVTSDDEDVVLLMPTFPEVAPYHNETILKSVNAAYAFVFNLLGLPVTQCPTGRGKHGMPIGLQIATAAYKDHLTLSVAEEIETWFGGWSKP